MTAIKKPFGRDNHFCVWRNSSYRRRGFESLLERYQGTGKVALVAMGSVTIAIILKPKRLVEIA
jgi:hypothetical protein